MIMVSKSSSLPMRPRKLWYPRPYLLMLMSLSLTQPSSVMARRRYVSFVNSPSKCSWQKFSRQGQSGQKQQARCIRSRQLEFHQSSATDFTKLLSSSSDCGEIIHVLRKYGFGNRLVTLTNTDLSQRPMIAEIYAEGSMNICLIIRWVPPSSSTSTDAEKPPLLEVFVMNDDGMFKDRKVIDIGQITTLWQDVNSVSSLSTADDLETSLKSIFDRAQESLRNNILPIEAAMQNMYNGRMANRALPPTNNRHALTKKKQIPQISSQFTNSAHVEELFRNLLKIGGNRMSRLVDSAMATDYLYSDYCRDGDDEQLIRRMISGRVLAEDAASGGRFKRRSCLFVAAQYDTISGDMEDVQVTLVNGGWLAVDRSTKAAAEGRKFAMASNNINERSNSQKGPLILTAADERIAHRLECLAMGDVWKNESDHDKDKQLLELDVREALTSMNLPLTSQGATEALVKIGRWTKSANNDEVKSKFLFEPWSPELLHAARSLAQFEDRRRESYAKICYPSDGKISTKSGLEERTNLTKLPCVCIDAQRASFRDDSIGIRLRSSTGRKVNKSASKWEVLVHIADVSDIYFDRETDVNTRLLRQAAERRGQSRYDLPLGPLHLLPPVALSALSLATNKDNTLNRCVTLWAYIDERDGKLLDAGLERTFISSPRALSFAEATSLLDSGATDGPGLSDIKSILTVAERNLMLWSQYHQQRNQSAQKRDQRLSTKELISNQMNTLPGAKRRDDGVGYSFQRSRGHRIVDSSLDLYAFAVGLLMNRAKQPIPRAVGRGADRGGRLGTAPLRRYIDGLAQRQAVSVLCGFGEPLTTEECREASKRAALASDTIDNVRSSKQSSTTGIRTGSNRRQVSALHNLSRYLASIGGTQTQQRMKATSTGRNNEVVILGVGAIGLCKGVKGTLKSGEQVLVQVDNIDPEKGLLNVSLVQ